MRKGGHPGLPHALVQCGMQPGRRSVHKDQALASCPLAGDSSVLLRESSFDCAPQLHKQLVYSVLMGSLHDFGMTHDDQ